MADRGVATFAPTPAPSVLSAHAPVLGGSGGTPLDPKRFLNVAGVATPIQ